MLTRTILAVFCLLSISAFAQQSMDYRMFNFSDGKDMIQLKQHELANPDHIPDTMIAVGDRTLRLRDSDRAITSLENYQDSDIRLLNLDFAGVQATENPDVVVIPIKFDLKYTEYPNGYAQFLGVNADGTFTVYAIVRFSRSQKKVLMIRATQVEAHFGNGTKSIFAAPSRNHMDAADTLTNVINFAALPAIAYDLQTEFQLRKLAQVFDMTPGLTNPPR